MAQTDLRMAGTFGSLAKTSAGVVSISKYYTITIEILLRYVPHGDNHPDSKTKSKDRGKHRPSLADTVLM